MILPARRDIRYDRRLLIILLNYGYFRAIPTLPLFFIPLAFLLAFASIPISSIPAFVPVGVGYHACQGVIFLL